MLTKTDILEILQQKKALLKDCSIKDIALFGSYSKDLQNEDSDIDFLVDFDSKQETYGNLLRIYDVLEHLFSNKKIEVVTKNGLSKYLGNYILEEAIYV